MGVLPCNYKLANWFSVFRGHTNDCDSQFESATHLDACFHRSFSCESPFSAVVSFVPRSVWVRKRDGSNSHAKKAVFQCFNFSTCMLNANSLSMLYVHVGWKSKFPELSARQRIHAESPLLSRAFNAWMKRISILLSFQCLHAGNHMFSNVFSARMLRIPRVLVFSMHTCWYESTLTFLSPMD